MARVWCLLAVVLVASFRWQAGAESASEVGKGNYEDEDDAFKLLLSRQDTPAPRAEWVTCSVSLCSGADFDGDVVMLRTPNVSWGGQSRLSWAIADLSRVQASTTVKLNGGRSDFSNGGVRSLDFSCETNEHSSVPRESISLLLFNHAFDRFWYGNPQWSEWRIPLPASAGEHVSTNQLWDKPVLSVAITFGYERWNPDFYDPPVDSTRPPSFPAIVDGGVQTA